MEKNPHSGKFIVVEGLDGSGQTTQANLLKDFLEEKGHEVVLTKEPTKDSVAGRRIRKILDKKFKLGPNILQQLFTEDRAEHLENVVIPALKAGIMVISDRYCFSSFAFGVASGVELKWLIHINSDFLLPDLAFILRVSPKICVERIEKRGKRRTLFEEKEKLEKVWQTYQILPNRFRNIYIINGEKPIREVFSQVKTILKSKLDP